MASVHIVVEIANSTRNGRRIHLVCWRSINDFAMRMWWTKPRLREHTETNVQFINSIPYRVMTFEPSPERYEIACCHCTNDGLLEYAAVTLTYDNVWVIKSNTHILLYTDTSAVTRHMLDCIIATERSLNGLTSKQRLQEMIPQKLLQIRRKQGWLAAWRWHEAYIRVYARGEFVPRWRLIFDKFPDRPECV